MTTAHWSLDRILRLHSILCKRSLIPFEQEIEVKRAKFFILNIICYCIECV